MEGGKEGKIKTNYKASLVYFEKAKQTKTINVDKEIEYVVKLIE
jgi:hypothetical protein